MTNQQTQAKGDILIVDDTPDSLHLLNQMLTQQGYKVRPVPDGPRALAAARSTPPDLILLDIKMPAMDGYQVCEQLKVDDQTHDIPILFLSALEETEDKVKAFAAGGVDYVTKPFQVEELLARVETHLSLRTLQKQLEATVRKLEKRNAELEEAMSTIKTLSGLIPICAWCRKVRNDRGYWDNVENYIKEHSMAEFEESLCPNCKDQVKPV